MTKKHLAIIDYGMGNLHSVASAIGVVAPDVKVSVTADSDIIQSADHIIFPGVGAMRDCMAGIHQIGAGDRVREALAAGKPVLGICVGMQALMTRSDENDGVDALNIIPGQVHRFPSGKKDDDGSPLKVPHMGWNKVQQKIAHPMWKDIEDGARFYFVHSYYVEAENAAHVAGECHYGIAFAAAISEKNLFAVQFHPEKSHDNGLQLLKNFTQWDGTL